MGSGVTETAIRPVSADDLDTVVAMEKANQTVPWSEGIFRDEMAAENRVYLAAADGEVVIGFGGVMVIGEEAHITNLLVAPPARKRGIGLRLMIALIQAALAMGARHLTLEVRSRNQAARALYARLGLVPVGVRKGYYPDDDALIMWAHDIDGDEYGQRLDGLR